MQPRQSCVSKPCFSLFLSHTLSFSRTQTHNNGIWILGFDRYTVNCRFQFMQLQLCWNACCLTQLNFHCSIDLFWLFFSSSVPQPILIIVVSTLLKGIIPVLWKQKVQFKCHLKAHAIYFFFPFASCIWRALNATNRRSTSLERNLFFPFSI